MRPGPPFKVDPTLSRTIRPLDLVFAALGAFVAFPILSAAFGAIMLVSANTFDASDSHPVRLVGEFILGVGYTGLFAWAGTPIALGIGWFASRKGFIGWATAPLAGALGGVLFSLIFFALEWEFGPAFLPLTFMFVLISAIYAIAGWLALRWLVPECFVCT
ncbi:MAG: hypothetical protein HKN27_15245 [Silicimonas sp.]|nr:hypothetical protein [Silicimonas sp.]